MHFAEDNNLGASKESTIVEAPAKTTKEQLVVTTPAASTSTTTASSPVDEQQPINDNPLGIKIKEITKPEEIRITDDKPKLFKPPARTTSLAATDATTSTAPTVVALDHPAAGLSPGDIIAEEDTAAGNVSADMPDLDHIDIIEPETLADVDHENIDDLSSFVDVDGNGDDNDTEHENGNKSIRQTAEPLLEADGDLTAAAASTSASVAPADVVISDKLLEMPASSTEGGGGSDDDATAWWSSTAMSMLDAASTSETVSEAAPRETGQLIYINGKPFQLRETDGLTRGSDDEEEPKGGRKTANSQQENVFATTTAASASDDNDVLAASSSMSSLEASGGSEIVFEAVYYEPVTEAPTDLSSEVFETLDRTGQSESSNSVETKATSHEFIDVPLAAAQPTISLAFDGSGSSDGPSAYTEEPDVEGSTGFEASHTTGSDALSSISSSTDASSSAPSFTTSAPASTSDEPTSVAPVAIESTSTGGGIVNSNDDDKNREFPEQSDDYSLHSQQMQYEGGDAKSLREQPLSALAAAAAASDHSTLTVDADHDDVATSALRVIPIARRSDEPEASTTTDEQLRHSSYADVQERSPGEPYLVPEWERNATTEATRPPKFDRRDSLILLPVDDDADFGRSAAVAAASTAAAPTVASAAPAETGDDSADDASGAGSAATYNEVTGTGADVAGLVSAESRSIEDGFVDRLLGSSKYYFRVPGEFFRYQDKIMNS